MKNVGIVRESQMKMDSRRFVNMRYWNGKKVICSGIQGDGREVGKGKEGN